MGRIKKTGGTGPPERIRREHEKKDLGGDLQLNQKGDGMPPFNPSNPNFHFWFAPGCKPPGRSERSRALIPPDYRALFR